MLYCQVTPAPRLFIVPGAELHFDGDRFSNEMIGFMEDLSTEKSTLDSSQGCLNSDYFDLPVRTDLSGIVISKIRMGAENCLMYRIHISPRTVTFTRWYQLYTSMQESIDLKKNPLLGWTESSLFEQEEEEVSGAPIYYLCERYDYSIWRGELTIHDILQVATTLEALHKDQFCHWFVSPLTIRHSRKGIGPDIALVLPCIAPYFSSFISSVIPKPCRKFIAPEVKRYIKEGISVRDILAADVYSLCQVIYEKLKASLESRVELTDLLEVVTRGRAENPELRPALREVFARLEKLRL